MENPIFLWMTGGNPILGHPHMGFYNWLVVLNMFLFVFQNKKGMSSFPLTFIFFRGVQTTNQLLSPCSFRLFPHTLW